MSLQAAPRLLLLGPPRIEMDDTVTHLSLRKAIALLAYLAVEKRSFSREFLATLLWPDRSQVAAHADLRRTLSIVRRALGEGCIRTSAGQVELNTDLVETDIDEFHELSCAAADSTSLASLERAATLSRGAFLEGFNLGNCVEFDHWQDAVRESLRWEVDELLGTLTRSCMQLGKTVRGLTHARRWLELDRCNETAHRAVMEMLARNGRRDAARRQYQICAECLRNEGLEPDIHTIELAESIAANGAVPEPPASETVATPDRQPVGDGWRRRASLIRWLLTAAAASMLAIIIYLIPPPYLHGGIDSYYNPHFVSELHIAMSGNTLMIGRTVEYVVLLSADKDLSLENDIQIYTGELTLNRQSHAEVLLSLDRDIYPFARSEGMEIPPGYYYVGVIGDPYDETIAVDHNKDFSMEMESLYFSGTTAEGYFEVEIEFESDPPLSADNPLRVFIADMPHGSDRHVFGDFRITTEGTHMFGLDRIPVRDTDGSGYFMLVYHDSSGDMDSPYAARSRDIAASYREGEGNLSYGNISPGAATPIFPGSQCSFVFAPPPLPAPDAFEPDQPDTRGTVLSYDELPVVHEHTFHNTGTGDTDVDWYQIWIPEGGSLTVETRSADTGWESDTEVYVRGPVFRDLAHNDDKSVGNGYSRVEYTNTTGVAQWFHLTIYSGQSEFGDSSRWGSYVVEIGT